ncbi:MAG: neutral/alkaline non-lysosomal ceramidase N-terminal domain-containing protein [Candidatus Omnitrophica bacterium]|nr:neutral/alkaline non-lysosomal ceramidase N-terminal domain-containing protein [Candidatus Omnitrophota bacterium]
MFRAIGLLTIAIALFLGGVSAMADAGDFQVGVGKVVITPKKNMWMAGYASRTQPSDGKVHDLYAKALAIKDSEGNISVLVGSDVIGLPREMSQQVGETIEKKHGIPRERLMLTASHTHTGPAFRDNLRTMYKMDDGQWALVEEYSKELPLLLVEAIDKAIADLEPCKLYWGVGEAGFAKNRRKYTIGGVTNDYNPIGPVDHDVPVLKAVREDGSVKALSFGYACHNTTLGFYKFTGDYAGFAQEYLEKDFDGATAIFSAGCGGDQNPLPRRSLELAEKYGHELADAVKSVANSEMEEMKGPIKAQYREIDLPLSEPPTREELVEQTKSDNRYIQARAEALLPKFDEKGGLDTTYPYPIQIWDFTSGHRILALGGEAVVDYSLLFKHYLGEEKLWVIAYANDVMAYIPSLRVLREGGYEGAESMIYYGMYGPWAPQVESMIVGTVHDMVGKELDESP